MNILIDTPKSAFDNIYITYMLKNSPNTIRIFSFDKEYAIAGYHQDVSQEFRIDYLEKENITLAKNILSGQSVYVDEYTVGIEYIGFKDFNINDIFKSLIHAFKDLNIEAYIDGPTIKVGQKRLGIIHGLMEDDISIFQAYISIRLNIEKTLKSIHMPVEKLTSQGIKSADDRLESIQKALKQDISKEAFINSLINSFYGFYENITLEKLNLSYKDSPFGKKEFIFKDTKDKTGYIYGLYRCKGATFRVYIKEKDGILQDIFITGDYILYPDNFIKSLETHLIGKDIKTINQELDKFLEENTFYGIDIKKEDIKEAIMFAIRKLEGEAMGMPKDKLNNIIASIGGSVIENINKAKVMLLPYCAKPRWCDYRHLDDCGECGGCTIGDAYRLAYQKGMIPMTITSFELLRDTLLWCAQNNYTYIGHCCYEFYEKRYEAFQKASNFGANGILFDIVGTTCYNLGVEEEEKAYHGEFTVELDLIKDDLYTSMNIKEDANKDYNKEKQYFDFSKYLIDFKPNYYKKPKAVPTPEEDKTRTSMQIEVFKGEASIGPNTTSYKDAFSYLKDLIKSSKTPTIVIGPLLFWDFGEKELQEKALITRELIEKIPNVNIKILPDYKPKLKNYDPSVEMDPPNPHEAILHGNHDLTILIGTHCYRTDFIIRLLKKHTPTTIVVLCGLYGHPEADLSTSFTDANKLSNLVKML